MSAKEMIAKQHMQAEAKAGLLSPGQQHVTLHFIVLQAPVNGYRAPYRNVRHILIGLRQLKVGPEQQLGRSLRLRPCRAVRAHAQDRPFGRGDYGVANVFTVEHSRSQRYPEPPVNDYSERFTPRNCLYH
jgi:hypothetical protein